MKLTYIHPAEQIVIIMNRIYSKQMTTTSGGNLSICDEEGNLWITPSGIDKGSLTADDICQVKPDGTILGKHIPSSELPFHRCIYAARPEMKAVLHAHPQALVSFSLVGKIPSTEIIPSLRLICGEIGFAKYGLPGSMELGNKISEQFVSGKNAVIMENHGVVICGKNLFEAFMVFETLEHAATIQIAAKQIGKPHVLTSRLIHLVEKYDKKALEEFIPEKISSEEIKARIDICSLAQRAYDQNLFLSTQGVLSSRLNDHSFLITPIGVDRKYLKPEDLVRVDRGMVEKGKRVSRLLLLHQMIYQDHPQINAIAMGVPTNVMAFGVTGIPLDSKTIPESYIMMRNLVRVPFGTAILDPQRFSRSVTESTPVILEENEFILTVGNSLINAFDRLEVAEFTATTIIRASSIGEIDPISKDRIEEINQSFHLN